MPVTAKMAIERGGTPNSGGELLRRATGVPGGRLIWPLLRVWLLRQTSMQLREPADERLPRQMPE
jgi:hypothetical protein